MLTVELFDKELSSGLIAVVFTKPHCEMCDKVADVLKSLKVIVKMFDCMQKGGTGIMKRFDINYLPRTIFFNYGLPIGSFLWLKPENVIKEYLEEIKETGRLLSKSNDGEAVKIFHQRVIGLSNIDWDKVNKLKEADRLFYIGEKIIEERKDWSILSDEQILSYINYKKSL